MSEKDARPPGHTCPAIDQAQRTMRRLAWRIRNRPECDEDQVASLLAEGLSSLERVRDENKQMRAAYYRATSTVKSSDGS